MAENLLKAGMFNDATLAPGVTEAGITEAGARVGQKQGGSGFGFASDRNVAPEVSAESLTQPTAPITVPEPIVAEEIPTAPIAAAKEDLSGFIAAESEEAKRLQQLRDEQASFAGDTGLSSLFQQQLERSGQPEDMAALRDIDLQLAGLSEEGLGRQVDVNRAAGGTMAGTGRVISAEKARANVKAYGLAARASVLRGNIQMASQLATQAVQFAYQDRTLRNQNMQNQISSLQSVVDDQTAQLLEKDRRQYEEDQAQIGRIQTAVDDAMKSGVATANEVDRLTSPDTTDNERLALAQMIQAKGAKQLRDFDVAIKAGQLAKLREPTVATRETKVVEVGNEKQLIDTQTGEIIATFGLDASTDEIEMAKDAMFVNTIDGLKTHPGMAKAVGTTKLARFTPLTADVMTGQVADFTGSVQNIVKTLTLNTFEEAKAKGMTFGAMSKDEWVILGQTATKIDAWTRERDDGSIYYDTSEKNMQKELDVLSNFGKMDALRKGADPASIGVLTTEDGKYWTQNSDGSYTELTVTTK